MNHVFYSLFWKLDEEHVKLSMDVIIIISTSLISSMLRKHCLRWIITGWAWYWIIELLFCMILTITSKHIHKPQDIEVIYFGNHYYWGSRAEPDIQEMNNGMLSGQANEWHLSKSKKTLVRGTIIRLYSVEKKSILNKIKGNKGINRTCSWSDLHECSLKFYALFFDSFLMHITH